MGLDDILWDNMKNNTVPTYDDDIVMQLKQYKHRHSETELEIEIENSNSKYEHKMHVQCEQQLEFEQALISKKDACNSFSVQREYVNSKQFHDKFEKLPVSPHVQQILYFQAGRLLEKVDGQGEERMLAVNSRTGKFLVDNFDREGSIRGTGFTDEEYEKIEECSDFVTVMHNHSLNGLPSSRDLLSYLHDNNINLSLIVCHDGTIYSILDVKPSLENLYNKYYDEAKERTSDSDEVKRIVSSRLYETNNRLGKRHKIFTIEKL